MGRESFIFYRSFYEAMSDINDKDKLKLYNAICKYALYGEETELTGISNTLFKLIKPQLEANNKRFEDGKKGGRPKNITTGFEDKITTGYKKEKTTGFENKKPNVNDNVNGNYNENENIDDDYKKIVMYLGLGEKMPSALERQVELYKKSIRILLQKEEKSIAEKLDVQVLGKAWEKLNQAKVKENIKDEQSYFIKILKNEVEKRDNDRRT